MKSSFHLMYFISVLISTNCQIINKTQSGSEEYIPGDYQSGDYQSGDYYYYSDSNQILEFANFTKCCPEDQVSFWHIHFYRVSIRVSEGNDIKACQIRPNYYRYLGLRIPWIIPISCIRISCPQIFPTFYFTT